MLLLGEYTFSALTASILILFFGMGLHEFGHAFVADWWGDPTPRERGKLTLNPLAHIDINGWIWILLIGFGTGGSVAINPLRMRDPRWGSFWMSLAGPFTNLLQALVFGVLFRLFGDTQILFRLLIGNLEVWELGVIGVNPLVAYLNLLMYVGVTLNVVLFIFNLLPFFPLDGYRAVLSFLPGDFLMRKQIPVFIQQSVRPLSRFLQQPAYTWQSWQTVTYYMFIGLIGLSLFARYTNLYFLDALHWIIGGPVSQLSALIAGF